jgi:PTH1 family peptidyl-tRNA hydrolase
LGFLAVEKLAGLLKIEIDQHSSACLLGKGRIGHQRLLLGLPLTFMNLSGTAAAVILKQNKIKLKDLLIICDDVNLPVGRMRLRPKGSAGGHKGLASIIAALASEDFPRLRIGAGRPKKSGTGLSRHVLSGFNKKEIKLVNQLIDRAVDCAQVWTKEGITKAMNRFNTLEVNLKDV